MEGGRGGQGGREEGGGWRGRCGRSSACSLGLARERREEEGGRDGQDGFETCPVDYFEAVSRHDHGVDHLELLTSCFCVQERLPNEVVRDLVRSDSRTAANSRGELLQARSVSGTTRGWLGERTTRGARIKSCTPTPARTTPAVTQTINNSSSRGGI